MIKDPIVSEVRENRAKLAKRYGNSIAKIIAAARKRQALKEKNSIKKKSQR